MAKLGQMVFGLTGKHFDSNLDTVGKTQDSGYPPDRLNKRHNTDIWVLPPFRRIQLQMLPFPHSYELGLKLS